MEKKKKQHNSKRLTLAYFRQNDLKIVPVLLPSVAWFLKNISAKKGSQGRPWLKTDKCEGGFILQQGYFPA